MSFKKLKSVKPSVLFIAGTLGQGGAEKQLFLLARSLKLNGHHIWVLCLTKGEYWEHRLKDIGIEVFCNEHYHSRVARLFWMRTVYRACRPDVLYSFHFYTSIYTGLLRLILRNQPLCIGSIRNDGYSEIKANGQWSYWMMHLNHLIIANNEHGRHAVMKYFKISHNKITVLNNAVEIQNLRSSWPQNPLMIKLIFVGRLVPAKNPLLFLEICKRLHKQGQNFLADIFGEGELRPQIEEEIRMHNLSKLVHLNGNVPEVFRFFSEYDFLLTTSFHEGTPNVVLEALAAGLPVLSTSHTAALEILCAALGKSHLDEFLFADPDECVSKMKYLLKSPDHIANMTQKGIEYIRMNHDISQSVKHWLNIVSKF